MSRKNILNKLMILESDRKKQQNLAIWWEKGPNVAEVKICFKK